MSLQSLFHLEGKRSIYRVLISHTARSLAFSFVGIYIPIYFLTQGYQLREVISYYMILHGVGLLLALTIIPRLIQKWGLIFTFKLNYPFEILHLGLLFTLSWHSFSIYWIAPLAGAAVFFYWVPLNILLIKNADFDKMGSDLASFFALPKLFGIIGPLVGAGLVYFVGFWPTFLIAMIGAVLSYLPIAAINTEDVKVTFHWREAWQGLRRRKGLFLLESFDNIVEESEWFWGIYVFLLIGSLAVPGVVGSLAALGSALFTLFIGRKVNQHPRPVIILTSLCLVTVSIGQILANDAVSAYIITLTSSFMLTAFLVAYSSVIYRKVKGDEEEEFIILREIPTVLGRMIVFSGILLLAANPRYFFVVPLIAGVLLFGAFVFNKSLVSLTRRSL